MRTHSPFTDIQTAIEEIRAGRMIIVVDDEDRENEGDLTMAAEKITPEAVNFMAKYGRGLICLPLAPERIDYLCLRPMTSHNTARFGTAFTESIDAASGVTTGISARDRAQTIRCAIDSEARPSDLARPGHIFPLRAQQGGVLVRAGQTEASVDLARLAGLKHAGVICEIMNPDGTMARVPDLARFGAEHQMKMITVADLIRFRMAHERCAYRKCSTIVPTEFGEFSMVEYGFMLDGETHVAMIQGKIEQSGGPVLVRMHSHCLAGDVFRACSCSCAARIRSSLRWIATEGSGVLIYFRQNGPCCNSSGFALNAADSARAIDRHPNGLELGDVERQRQLERQIGIGAQILLDLDLRRVRGITDDPQQIAAFATYGIEVEGFASASRGKANAYGWTTKEGLPAAQHTLPISIAGR
jgi:3,4-dihydroxy 2-butanone 4-phosphate synthase / GTP cyclohydrolase II